MSSSSTPIPKKKLSSASCLFSRIDKGRLLLTIISIALLSSLLCIQLIPSKVTLNLGDTADKTIVARRSARYLASTDTELRRTHAEISVGKVYEPVPNASEQAIGALRTIVHSIESIRNSQDSTNVDSNLRDLRNKLGTGLGANVSSDSFRVMLSAPSQLFTQIEDKALDLLVSAMSIDIKDDDVDSAKTRLAKEAQNLKLEPKYLKAIVEIAQDCLRPNRVYSAKKTDELKQKARESIQSMYRQIMPGETVISKGETVLQDHVEKFEALGLLTPQIDFKMVLSLTAFVIFVYVLFAIYLHRYHPDIYSDLRSLILIVTCVFISTLALRIGGGLIGLPLSPAQIGHLGTLWIVTVVMLISVLIDNSVAVLIAALLSLILAMTLNNELRYVSASLITALVAIYSIQNLRGRSDFLHAVASIAIVGLLLDWILGSIAGDQIDIIVSNSFWTIGVAGLAGMLFWVGTYLLEQPLRKTTHISLLELVDTNKPLLKRLLMEAPGTYTHSVTVGFLAETAADAIGADSLLAKVASYYHDIGKMRRPHFFVENQSVENIHNRLNPTLSALIITSHVKDGVELGKDFGLPQIILDIISQHHGNSLVRYFYRQATYDQDESVALEQQFRYSGPKPQSKEAAIVMLADSVEAAKRSLDQPSKVSIELMVNRVISEKLREGQLDQSDLTFKEIGVICASFSRALLSTMHARIEYPDPADPCSKKGEPYGDSDIESPQNADQSRSIENSGNTNSSA